MIRCLACESARELLDAYVDGELPVSDHVAVEAHVRVCSVCAARVEDSQLIASSLRLGALACPTREDDRALAGLEAGMMARLRAEREAAVTSRLREAFVDMRLLWPALGAVGAVGIGLALAFAMLSLAGNERPESLAAMLHSVAQRGVVHAAEHGPRPGSEGNPLTLGNTMFKPELLDDESMNLEGILDEEAVVIAWTVVSPSGSIADFEMVGAHGRLDEQPDYRDALLYEALRRMRFAPGLGADGSSVAVEMVMVMAVATATPARPQPARVAQPVLQPPPPVVDDAEDERVNDPADDPAFRDTDFDSGRFPQLPRHPWT